MPDTFDRAVFEAEFETSDFTKGIDGMVNAFKRAQDAQAQLTKENGLTTESAKDAEEGIKKLTAQIAALDKTNKDYAATNQQLTGRLAALKGQYDKYTATIEKQNKELEANRATITKMAAAYDVAKKSVIDLQATANKPIAPAMNDGQIVNQIRNISDKSKQMGATLANSFDSSKSAIDNVSSGLSGLGMLWGPIGIAGGAALGAIVRKLYEMSTALTDAQIRSKFLAEEMKKVQGYRDEAVNSMAKETTAIALLINQIQSEILTKKERNEAITQLQSLAPEYFATLDREKATIEDITRAYANYTAGIRTAIEAKVTEKQLNDVIDQRLSLEQKSASRTNTVVGKDGKVVKSNNAIYDPNGSRSAIEDLRRSQEGTSQLFDDEYQRWKNLKESEDLLLKKLVDLEGKRNLTGKPTKDKAEKVTAEIQNIYQQELEKLEAAIAKMDEKGFTNEASITKALNADFDIRKSAYTKAFKKGQLSENELNDLNSRLKDLYNLTLNKNIKDFQDARAKYIQGINDQLETLQNEESLKRISTIQDSFERERQMIGVEMDKTIAATKQKRDKLIADIEKNAPKSGLRPEDIYQIDSIKRTYSDLLDDLEVIKQQKLQKLSFDTFEKFADDAKKSFDRAALNISQDSLIDIKQQTDLYLAGKISYEQYQKELTRISGEESDKRYFKEVENLRKQIRLREDQLVVNNDSLTEGQKQKLLDEITALQKQLAAAETTGAKIPKPDGTGNPIVDNIAKYVQAVGSLVQSVISFWQQANEAEQRSLERSIALQDRRVEAARNIAARGNAEYLRMEEERQQQLLIKQENAARRQIAINEAIQVSNILVAVAGAAAQIAKGGPFNVIAGIATIVGALASGYALIKAAQQNQPSFYVGTEDTGRGGNVDNKGGFNAILHPGERVVTAEDNKKLKGITNKQLVETVQKSRVFVEQWKSKPAPSLNMAAMEMASNTNDRVAGIMEENNKKLDENNELQKKIIHTLKGMGFSFNWDRNGVEAAMMQALDQREINKKL